MKTKSILKLKKETIAVIDGNKIQGGLETEHCDPSVTWDCQPSGTCPPSAGLRCPMTIICPPSNGCPSANCQTVVGCSGMHACLTQTVNNHSCAC